MAAIDGHTVMVPLLLVFVVVKLNTCTAPWFARVRTNFAPGDSFDADGDNYPSRWLRAIGCRRRHNQPPYVMRQVTLDTLIGLQSTLPAGLFLF